MASDLVFNSFKICDYSAGDRYSRVGNNVAALALADISFPGTAGRELRVIGSQNAPDLSQTLTFGPSGRNSSVIFKTGATLALAYTAMESFLYGATNSIQALLTNATTQTASLVDADTTYTGMRFVHWALLTPITVIARASLDCVFVQFEARFEKYVI